MKLFKIIRSNLIVLTASLCLSQIINYAAFADSIRYADSDPTTCLRCQFLEQNYFPLLSKTTNNKVEINSLFGGVLGTNKNNLKLVSDGVVEFSSTFVGYHNNIFPAQSAFDLFPRGPKSFEGQLYFYRQAYERIPQIRAELSRHNLKLVMINPLLHLAFASKQPITSLDDIQNQKWRAGTKSLLRYLENIGAIPVSVPWDDVYISLQTGLINGVLTNYDGLNNAKFYEPAPHILISPELWMANPMIYFVNLDYWNSLDSEIQDAWMVASESAELMWGRQLDAAREEIIQSQRSQGVIVNEITDEDIVKWDDDEKLQEAREEWIQEASTAGLSNARSVLDELIRIHSEALLFERH